MNCFCNLFNGENNTWIWILILLILFCCACG